MYQLHYIYYIISDDCIFPEILVTNMIVVIPIPMANGIPNKKYSEQQASKPNARDVAKIPTVSMTPNANIRQYAVQL